jgi:hypothetical protein
MMMKLTQSIESGYARWREDGDKNLSPTDELVNKGCLYRGLTRRE